MRHFLFRFHVIFSECLLFITSCAMTLASCCEAQQLKDLPPSIDTVLSFKNSAHEEESKSSFPLSRHSGHTRASSRQAVYNKHLRWSARYASITLTSPGGVRKMDLRT